MRRLMTLLLASCATALCSLALATDQIPVDHVRFSGDGSRVMVMTSGNLDGSGFGTASLSVLSTASGSVLHRRTRTADLGPNTLRLFLLTTPPTPAVLRAAGLQPGRVSAARFNRTYPAPYPQWSDATTAGQTQVTPVALWARPVPIRLEVYALPSSCDPDLLPPGGTTAGFRLTVNTQTLHQDVTLPADRRCAGGYTLERVDVQGNRALLTLRSYGPGFEGPDATPVFIAATLR